MRFVQKLLPLLILAGCQTFAKTNTDASSEYLKTTGLSSLTDIGDVGGQLVVAVVNNQDTIKYPKIPRVDKAIAGSKEDRQFALSDFIKRSGLSNSRKALSLLFR